MLQVFGSRAFALHKNKNKRKFDTRAEEGVSVSYSKVSKAYRVWMPRQRIIKITRDVKDLNKMYYKANSVSSEVEQKKETYEIVQERETERH